MGLGGRNAHNKDLIRPIRKYSPLPPHPPTPRRVPMIGVSGEVQSLLSRRDVSEKIRVPLKGSTVDGQNPA